MAEQMKPMEGPVRSRERKGQNIQESEASLSRAAPVGSSKDGQERLGLYSAPQRSHPRGPSHPSALGAHCHPGGKHPTVSTAQSHPQQAQTSHCTVGFSHAPSRDGAGHLQLHVTKGHPGTCLETPGTPTATSIQATVTAMVSGGVTPILATHLLSWLGPGFTQPVGLAVELSFSLFLP